MGECYRRDLYIDGRWVAASDGARLPVICPATEAVLAEVAAASVADTDAAVAAARRALDGAWGQVGGAQRGRLLNKLADLVERDALKLARIEAANVGKPVGEPSHIDIPTGIATLRTFAGWA
ncbi:MAG TPA: aldehyde dehydrogenase family protein, partial [Stellaceae bacterium]|nr:aldehyde dehydrogenase family protein [Stellaceae bacterium]